MINTNYISIYDPTLNVSQTNIYIYIYILVRI